MNKIFAAIICAVLPLGLSAQGLNTTVDVTNDYTSSFAGLSKRNLDVNIPDSLLQFNKDFKYSTFDNAYRGSYKFTPYSVEIKPERGEYGRKNFYLTAGAGYQLRPVLKAVFTPAVKDSSKFSINFFQDGEAYIGEYVDLGNGYKATEKLGADFLASFKKLYLRGNVLFDGAMLTVPGISSSLDFSSNMYSGTAELSLSSVGAKVLAYSVDAHYNFSSLEKKMTEDSFRTENYIDASATLEPILGKNFRIPVDVDLQFNGNVEFALVPHFQMNFGPFGMNLGARFDYLYFNDNESNKRYGLTIHPDVELDLSVLKKSLDFYIVATGGRHLYGSQEIFSYNPFLNQIQDAYSEESLNAYGGIRGQIANHLEYDVNAGYDIIASAPFCAYDPAFHISNIHQEKMNLFYVNAKLAWKSEWVDVDGSFRYNYSDWSGESECLDLPQFKGDLRAKYNWNNILAAGVYGKYSSRRVSTYCYNDSAIPAYLDLGVFAEYHISRKFSVWAEGKNLLSQKIYLYPGYAEKGIGIVAGINLNL